MLTPRDIEKFGALVKRESGLVLTAEQDYLVQSRLGPVAGRHTGGDLALLLKKLQEDRSPRLLQEAIEAMLTPETFFFRDAAPFQALKDKILPALLRRPGGDRRLRFWSAACASGQEAYSLSMLLKDYPLPPDWRYEIFATDVSYSILERAREGLYTQFEVQRGLPIQLLIRHFTKEGEMWRVKPEVRAAVRFAPANLLAGSGHFGAFDVIFCRNVLIYFDAATKARVLRSLKPCLAPGGVLFLGSAETVIGLSDDFAPLPEAPGAFTLS